MAQAAFALAAALSLTAESVARPRILGLSHAALRVSDVARSLAFYEEFLGYRTLTKGPKSDRTAVLVLVNERQSIELRPGLRPEEDRLDHVALETDDVAAMRRYLASRGISVPADIDTDAAGDRFFTVKDPEGHTLELVQHARGGWRKPPASASDAISSRILHAGIVVVDLAAATQFYAGVLGLKETWRGSRSGTVLSWTNMKVPDGTDYLEFMLFAEPPPPNARGTPHHVCLEVASVEKARGLLEARPYRAAYERPLEIRVGTNRKRQLNLFDPDGTRAELMEPDTVDGQPAPSSTAPPPRRP